MKKFRSTQVRTSSLNHSSELNLPPNHIQDILVKGCMSTKEWTDEKHSLYLKFMEATFVNQLYNSKQMLGWCSPEPTFSHSTTTTSGQHCVRCSRKDGRVASGVNVNVEESISSTSEVSNLGQRRKRNPSASPHHKSFSHTDTEMSDQNFVDEVVVCHKGKRQNSKDWQC